MCINITSYHFVVPISSVKSYARELTKKGAALVHKSMLSLIGHVWRALHSKGKPMIMLLCSTAVRFAFSSLSARLKQTDAFPGQYTTEQLVNKYSTISQ